MSTNKSLTARQQYYLPSTSKKTFANYGLISSKEIADEINRIFGRTISQQTVWHYRVQFGFKYCRLRKSPLLSELDKFKRLFRYSDCDFSNYIFVDESCVRISKKALYNWRLKSSYPDTLPSSHKFLARMNVWGGISSFQK
ncbi:hypothetical protein BpHYR1_042841 [Brachionus plicatilis]|uniref:Uncharacterized protein n=1 Tax=Brachionus plicatilis TaxID=10195 RepID=A0A3M7SFF8_BRAPC|nr:hypothetical protein BpHYR1_042841 [Brachionus plicatilis]